MQDEVREKSVALTIKVGKAGGRLTAGLLKWAIRKYLAQAQNPKIHHGKQTVKQLVSQGAGVQNIEITGKNIKSFERVARKYGVDFALKKDPAQGKYLVFFKARDADALNAAFAEYAGKSLNRSAQKKPSLLEEADRPFPKEEELREKSARLNQLNRELSRPDKKEDEQEQEVEESPDLEDAGEPAPVVPMPAAAAGHKPSIRQALRNYEPPAPVQSGMERTPRKEAVL